MSVSSSNLTALVKVWPTILAQLMSSGWCWDNNTSAVQRQSIAPASKHPAGRFGKELSNGPSAASIEAAATDGDTRSLKWLQKVCFLSHRAPLHCLLSRLATSVVGALEGTRLALQLLQAVVCMQCLSSRLRALPPGATYSNSAVAVCIQLCITAAHTGQARLPDISRHLWVYSGSLAPAMHLRSTAVSGQSLPASRRLSTAAATAEPSSMCCKTAAAVGSRAAVMNSPAAVPGAECSVRPARSTRPCCQLQKSVEGSPTWICI
jgi:hypothetical protein